MPPSPIQRPERRTRPCRWSRGHGRARLQSCGGDSTMRPSFGQWAGKDWGSGMAANWGLRSKSVLALLLACVLALIPALLLGWQAMEDIRQHFGEAYVRNFTLLHRERIVAPVARAGTGAAPG